MSVLSDHFESVGANTAAALGGVNKLADGLERLAQSYTAVGAAASASTTGLRTVTRIVGEQDGSLTDLADKLTQVNKQYGLASVFVEPWITMMEKGEISIERMTSVVFQNMQAVENLYGVWGGIQTHAMREMQEFAVVIQEQFDKAEALAEKARKLAQEAAIARHMAGSGNNNTSGMDAQGGVSAGGLGASISATVGRTG